MRNQENPDCGKFYRTKDLVRSTNKLAGQERERQRQRENSKGDFKEIN